MSYNIPVINIYNIYKTYNKKLLLGYEFTNLIFHMEFLFRFLPCWKRLPAPKGSVCWLLRLQQWAVLWEPATEQQDQHPGPAGSKAVASAAVSVTSVLTVEAGGRRYKTQMSFVHKSLHLEFLEIKNKIHINTKQPLKVFR